MPAQLAESGNGYEYNFEYTQIVLIKIIRGQ